MYCVAAVKGHVGVRQGKPEVKFHEMWLMLPRACDATGDPTHLVLHTKIMEYVCLFPAIRFPAMRFALLQRMELKPSTRGR